MGHYDEQYERWDEKTRDFKNEKDMFETPPKTYTLAFSQELMGYVENGIGKDEREAREAYIDNLEGLINFLDKKRIELMYDVVDLEYTDIKEL